MLFASQASILASHASINVRIDGSSAATTTAPSFLGANIDAASLYQQTRLDFADADFRQLGSRLGGALDSSMTLRLGGSAADDLRLSSDQNASHGQIILPLDYFDELQAFVQGCGFRLAWDLNGMRMRNTDGSWDPTNARALLEHVKAAGQPLWAVQLGNEPGHFQTRSGGFPTPTTHGADFLRLKALLHEIFGDHATRPRVQGPDACFGHGTDASPCANLTYMRSFLAAAGRETLDDLTVHNYGLTGPGKNGTQCQLQSFLTPGLWEEHLLPSIAAWEGVRREMAPGARLVLSETASAADTGCPGLSNRFASGFSFVGELGALGDAGVHQVYRQDLVGFSGINGGSHYALAGPPGWYSRAASGRLTPNPDFFTALLWRSIVGPRRLRVTSSAGAGSATRWYAACAVGGGVALMYVNPTEAPLEVHLVVGASAGGAPLELYLLTAPGGNLTSGRVLLNGVLLNATSPLPFATGDAADPVRLPAHSYGFVVDREARPPACAGTGEGPVRDVQPRGPPACLDPRDFGAVEGDSGGSAGPHWASNTAALQAAIDAAPTHASRCVEVRGGDFVSADLYLHSHSTFRVAEGARLLVAVNQTGRSLIHIDDATNVTLEGGGTLYGNAEYYISYFQPLDDRYEPTFPDGDARRPHLVIVNRSRGVRVAGLALRNATEYNIWIKACDDVGVDRVTIVGDSRFPNNDGIEPDSSTRVSVTNSIIDVADDGISPISSVADGPLRDLLVRNVTIRSKSHAIKFGSACEAECSGCLFENITIHDSNSGLAIQQRGTVHAA